KVSRNETAWYLEYIKIGSQKSVDDFWEPIFVRLRITTYVTASFLCWFRKIKTAGRFLFPARQGPAMLRLRIS
ncbi:hypothetical protein, partial [Enterococcus gilvus]|uniref:hypothetical protein n=1 Tax=Enterococcus gilvus TaxID=160453 RepID=UPI003ED93013